MGMIFGIYTFNRFTDTAEDFTNDIGRVLFFQRKRVLPCVLAVRAHGRQPPALRQSAS